LNELILHIETSTKACSVALSNSGQCIAIIEKNPDDYIHGEYVTLFIEEVLTQVQKSIDELNAVSVSIGPGSYTGLRIGLSVAKGICYGLKIPLIAISSLDCLLEMGRIKHPKHTLCAVMDARRMEVYSKIETEKGEVLLEQKAVVIDENSFIDYDPFVYFGDGSSKLNTIWSERNLIEDPDITISASGQIASSILKYRNGDFEDMAYCKPIYLKEFGAI
jgi:tRNA threonylcarbamoyladenosine biosynthesis protein TsaB